MSQRGTCRGSSARVCTPDDKFRSTTESTHHPNLPLAPRSVAALLRSHDAKKSNNKESDTTLFKRCLDAFAFVVLFFFNSVRCCKQPVRYAFTRSRIFTLMALFVSVAVGLFVVVVVAHR